MAKITLTALLAASVLAPVIVAQPASPIRLVQTVPLPGVTGHFDHFAFDASGRLFATLQQQGIVQVLDARTGKIIGAISGIGKPHAVLYRADIDRLFITDGDHNHGKVHIVDGHSFQLLKSVELAPGAEQFGYDSAAHAMYVANGGHDAGAAFGFVSVIDTDHGEKVADIRVETPNLEGVAVENASGRVFVNDRLHSQVVVIDRKQRTVLAQWQISTAKLNVALALDETGHRLFVGCRSGQIVVFNTDTGMEQATLPIAEGVDDLFFDAASKRIFAATGGGGGTVEAYEERDPDHYQPAGKVASAAEGKNGIYVPQVRRYFVGVTGHDPGPATILVFDVTTAGAASAQEPDRYVPVKAPYAQTLVRQTAAAHPEMAFIGLHVTPPGQGDNLIIACTDPSKIGRVSTALDMEVVKSKGTKVHFNQAKNDYEVDQWFSDAAGATLGMIVYRFPAGRAKSEDDALRFANAIREELRNSIPSRARLFQE